MSPQKKKPTKIKDITAEYSHRDEEDLQDERSDDSDNDSEESLELGKEESDGPTSLVVAPEILPAALDGLPAYYDPLKQYIKEISKYSLLTPEEEFDLAARLKDHNDLEAARILVCANLRLVVKIAMEYRSTYSNVMDLIQEGNVGLMKAVSKYDSSKGAKLSYYASWWIRSYILKYILDNFRLVKVGTTQAQKKLFYQLMKEKEKLEAQGLESGPKLLASRLNVKEKDVVEMSQRLGATGSELSLSAPIGGASEDSQATFQDSIPDHADLQDNQVEIHQLKDVLLSHLPDFVKQLKDKELVIFKERLNSDEPKTLQEIADKFGMTRERARQIEARIIEKMQDFYKEFLK